MNALTVTNEKSGVTGNVKNIKSFLKNARKYMRIVSSLMSRLTIYVTSTRRDLRKRGREVNYEFMIPGRLPGMNEYTQACRSNPFVGSKMKKDAEIAVMHATNIGLSIDRPVFIYYRFYEKNKRRDLDNISGFAHKVIQDALVDNGILEDDGWTNIIGFDDSFFIDKEHPRIELTIHEVRNVRDS